MVKTCLITVFTLLCCLSGFGQLTVWPGDANVTLVANHYDLLNIGLGFGTFGTPRNIQGGFWQAIPNVPAWTQNTNGGVNYAHLDCNGDGIIDVQDVTVLDTNFGSMGGGFLQPDSSSVTGAGAPSLQLDFPLDSVTVMGTTTYTLDINLGSQAQPIDSIYGIAFTIEYDSIIVDDVTISPLSGWMNTDSLDIQILKHDTVNSKVYAAISRTNQQNVAGFGRIGTIGIVMDDNIRIAAGSWILPLEITEAYAITASEAKVMVHPVGDTVVVSTITSVPSASAGDIRVYPNPVGHSLVVDPAGIPVQAYRLFDAAGRLVWQRSGEALPAQRIDFNPFPEGMYILEIQSDFGILRRKLLRRR